MNTIQFKKDLDFLSLDIDVKIPSKGVISIFGRSGSGKTSFINVVSGLITPDSGNISLDNLVLFDSDQEVNVALQDRKIGYVFQDSRLFPHMNVRKNLDYGIDNCDEEYFSEVISLLGLEDFLSRSPLTLSGGEKQRVAIARALLIKPQLLVMDEPLASLDLPRKNILISYLDKLVEKINIPILYVSHDLDELLRLSDYMIILEKGQVVVSGNFSDVWGCKEMRPWLGSSEQSSVINTKIYEHHKSYDLTKLDLGSNQFIWVPKLDYSKNSSVRVRIFAKDISVCKTRPVDTSIRNILEVVISDISIFDENVELKLNVGESYIYSSITKWASDEMSLSIGDALFAQIKAVSVTSSDVFNVK